MNCSASGKSCTIDFFLFVSTSSSVYSIHFTMPVGDQFISWSSEGAYNTTFNKVTMIHSIKSDTWMSQFNPTSTYVPSVSGTGIVMPSTETETVPSRPSETSDKVTPGSKAGLIGKIMGGVVVIATIAGLIFYRQWNQGTAGRGTRPDDRS